MTDTPFLARLRAEIQNNGGRPPGERRFYKATGLSRDDLWAAGYSSYGDACRAVGSEPNLLRQRFTDDELLRPLAELVRALGKFPSARTSSASGRSSSSSVKRWRRRLGSDPTALH